MLRAINIGKRFSDGFTLKEAVKNVDFCLNDGEICALVGESGSGKSTLSRILSGIISPSSGDVLLDGKSIIPPARRKNKEICSQIQLVLQDAHSALDPRFTVFDCIVEPIINLCHISKDERKERVFSLMNQMGLPLTLSNRKSHELSGGQQKRVCIARALASEPRIIIFDEAVSGLDVLVRKEILDLIKQLHREHKTSYLFITHDMDVALYLADRVVVMKDGKKIEEQRYIGDKSVFTHPYTKLLLGHLLV